MFFVFGDFPTKVSKFSKATFVSKIGRCCHINLWIKRN